MQPRLLLVIVAVVAIAPWTARAACLSPAVSNGTAGWCLFTTSTPLTFWRAAEACLVDNGQLTSILTSAEQSNVVGLTGTSERYWIGLYEPVERQDAFVEEYEWIDGSPTSYQNWECGDGCVESGWGVYMDTDGEWVAESSAHLYPAVCKKQDCTAHDIRCLRCSTTCDLCQPGYEGATCTPVADYCPTHAAPDNGVIDSCDASVGGDCHFSCNAGFTLWGSSTRTCAAAPPWDIQGQGSWTGVPPTCVRAEGHGPCETYEPDGSRCYLYLTTDEVGDAVNDTASFEAARAVCTAWGGRPAMPRTPSQSDLFAHMIKWNSAWIGLSTTPQSSYKYRDGTEWIWEDGTLLTDPLSRDWPWNEPTEWEILQNSGWVIIPHDPGLAVRKLWIRRRFVYSGYGVICERPKCTVPNCNQCDLDTSCLVCDSGYTLNATGGCDLIPDACPVPAVPANGARHDCDTSLGGTCTFSCDNGHALVGPASLTCISMMPMTFESPFTIEYNDDDASELVSGNIDTGYVTFTPASYSMAAVRISLDTERAFRGMRVREAHLRFTADGSWPSTGPLHLEIWAEATPQPDPYTDRPYNLTGRALLPFSVTWNATESWVNGEHYYTPDVSSLLNAVLALPSFNGRDASISFLINATAESTGERDASSDVRLYAPSFLNLAWDSAPPECLPFARIGSGRCTEPNVRNGACYSFHEEDTGRDTAAQRCRARGGYLATLDAPEDQQWVADHFNATQFPYIWTGLMRRFPFERWQWRTGETIADDFEWSGSGDQPNSWEDWGGVLGTETSDIYDMTTSEDDKRIASVCRYPVCSSPCATCATSGAECVTCDAGFAVPPACAVTAPLPPTDVLVVPRKRTFNVSWEAPAIAANDTITFEVGVDGAVVAAAAASEAFVTGLAPDTTYTVTVRTVGLAGASQWSTGEVVTTWTQCPPGSANNDQDGSLCEPCRTGFYSEAGNTCATCPQGTTSRDNATLAGCLCVKGMWSPTGEPGLPCDACPVGASCPGGSARPPAAPGYYDDGQEFVRCRHPRACVGGQAGASCASGHVQESYMCSSCLPGYFMDNTGRCTKCPAAASALVAMLVVGTVAVATVVTLTIGWLHASTDCTPDALASGRWRRRRIPHAISVFIIYVQILGVLSGTQLSWPSTMRAILQASNTLGNLDITLFSGACTISAFSARYATSILLPLLFVAAVAFVASVQSLGRRLGLWQCARVGDLTILQTLEQTVFRIGPLAYIPLCKTALVLYDCTRLPRGWRLDVDLKEACFDAQWWSLQPLAVPAVLLYVVGLPGIVALVLWRRRGRLQEAETVQRFGVLYELVRIPHASWSVFVLLKRLGLVFCSLFLSNVQLWFLGCQVAMFLASSSVTTGKRPFFRPVHNSLEARLDTAVLMVLLLGGVFWANDYPNAATEVTFEVLAVCVVAASLLLLAVTAVAEIRGQRSRDKGTDTMGEREEKLWRFLQNELPDLENRDVAARLESIMPHAFSPSTHTAHASLAAGDSQAALVSDVEMDSMVA